MTHGQSDHKGIKVKPKESLKTWNRDRVAHPRAAGCAQHAKSRVLRVACCVSRAAWESCGASVDRVRFSFLRTGCLYPKTSKCSRELPSNRPRVGTLHQMAHSTAPDPSMGSFERRMLYRVMATMAGCSASDAVGAAHRFSSCMLITVIGPSSTVRHGNLAGTKDVHVHVTAHSVSQGGPGG